MAVTIDDLPYMNAWQADYVGHGQRATGTILGVLRAHKATAVGFVNEGKLWAPPGEHERRVALLKQWVDAGMTLANHTYSHPDFNTRTVEEFKKEIVDGEPITRRLMRGREPYQAYFRHPMTHTGDTKEKKNAIDAFLASRGYTVAPHTIENSDFMFNPHYVDGLRSGNAAEAQRLRGLYLDHTIAATAFAERISVEIFGREVPQTLLIHSNDITTDSLDEMLTRFEARGYRFITLDAAMKDDAYRTRDTYVGTYGPTWLFRWSRSLGQTISFKDDPDPPPLPSPRR
jgi:peptidoglycan/xylan/chitin deacetylase (PgdA/CDA1 family)